MLIQSFDFDTYHYTVLGFGRTRLGFYSNRLTVQIWRTRS